MAHCQSPHPLLARYDADTGFSCDGSDHCWVSDTAPFAGDGGDEVYCPFHAPRDREPTTAAPGWSVAERGQLQATRLAELLDEWRAAVADRDPEKNPLAFVLPELQVGDVDFSHREFPHPVMLPGAHFRGQTNFKGAKFGARLKLSWSVFGGDTSFREAQFTGSVLLDNAEFKAACGFSAAHFGRRADFALARFRGEADLTRIRVDGRADFEGIAFRGRAAFGEAQFGDTAVFVGAEFFASADFSGTRFDREAAFHGVRFGGHATFRQ